MNHDDIHNRPLVRKTLDEMRDEKPLGQSRRRFAQIGLGGGLLTMAAGRPVWANQCSISGMMSGNLSRYPMQVVCGGCSPTFWSNDATHNSAHKWPMQMLPAQQFNIHYTSDPTTDTLEDLGQLIHDAKAARVRVIVKLVSSEGIGTIAVGV
ncbi:MAG: hypothetical protein AAF493_27095, partial [Pseudomonadota bacterium]